MKTNELLAELRRRKVRLWTEQGELKCAAPKGSLTPELRELLVERKAELIGLVGSVQKEVGNGTRHRTSIERLPEGELAPLTFQQQRLWFLQQLEPDLAAYNIPLNWTLKGPLEVAALERALSAIIRRHEIMRTVFEEVDGAPMQVVKPAPRIELRVEADREGLPVDVWRRKVLTMMMRDGESAFDVQRGPMYRTRLFRVKDDEHILYVPVHHAIFDGVSIGVFLRELIDGYEACLRGDEPSRPELPIQYGDFSAWQRQHYSGDRSNPVMDYWRRNLAGRLPVLELPTDRPRPPVQTYNGAHKELKLPWELVDRVRALGNEEGATLYMTLLSVYKLLLHAYTGQQDLIVGSAINGRNHTEVEELIGFFVNTLVLRTDLSGNPSFRDLLRRVRDVCLGAYENYDVPFEWLVEEVQPERNLSYSPIFQTLFLHELEPDAAKKMGPLVIEPETKEEDLSFEIARNDLTFWISFDDKDFIAWAEYNTDLFDGDRIVRLLRHYQQLLEEVTRDPDRPLNEISVLPEAEREQLIAGWNDTAADYPAEPIHVQFEHQAAVTPDAPALVYPAVDGADEELSYRELDERATRLARHLRASGVEPDTLVGLCLERSADMVVAQLAIMKAGAAYVPLDPAFPVDRLTYMVGDSGLSVIVTRDDLRGLFDGLERPEAVRFVAVDAEAGAIAARDAARFDSGVGLGQRMYVIYTSGSTGRPKGVEIEHRSVSNFLASIAREPGFRAGERLFAVTTLSFDISVLELMLPLVTGGTVIVAPKEATADGATMIAMLERLRPHVMQATPATWRMLMLSGWQGARDMRLFCGGEALPRELADELLPLGKELWNLYGPTEATIWSTIWRVEPGEGPVLIGRPIASTQVYVLDRDRRPVPAGIPGELWIGGDGLARGYLQRPELTAERFVPNPFDDTPGARMYLTGDLARWHADGTLECLGRIDNQIKLRGYRIELGEIEAVVTEHPAVGQCVTIVREDTPGDQRLTAYCRLEEGAGELDPDALRGLCREKLPAYMVPATFVPIDEFPLTPNNKVDRLALGRTKLELAGAAEEYVAPRNELEAKIAAVWGELLGLERVPIHSNFFDLGGHSLLLAQLRVALAEALEREITVIQLFQYPSVAALAGHLGEAVSSRKQRARAEERDRRGKSLSAGRAQLMRRRRSRG